MNRKFRLTSSIDIKRVRRLGSSTAHPLVVLIHLENEQSSSRFAVTAGVSVGNAVKRNRAKRLIRAALQSLLPEIEEGHDIVLVAREPLAGSNCQQTKEALQSVLQRAGLLDH